MTNKNEQRKVPELRFPEFSGEWEEKLLKEVTRINRKTDEIQDQFIYIDLESVEKGRLTKIKEVSKKYAPSRAQRVIEIGDILFQTVRPYQQNHFLYDKLFTNKQVVASTGYAQIRTLEQIYEKFIYQIFYSNKFSQKVDNKCTGTSYPAINASDLGSISISIPTYKEQQKIGEFFSKLDRQIELEEKKLALLEEQKKGYMQKIFSQELRFKDENDEEYPKWERKKLKDILYEVNEKSSKNNQYAIISSTNKGLVLQEEYFKKQIASSNTIGYKILRKNQVVLSPQNLWMGNINANLRFEIGLVSPSYKIFEIDERYNIYYISELLRTKKMFYNYKNSSEQGASIVRRNLNLDMFLQIETLIPCIDEQNKISNLLESSSKKIKVLGNKIKSMKYRKKVLLNKIFI